MLVKKMNDDLIVTVFILTCGALVIELMLTYLRETQYKEHCKRIWIFLIIAAISGYGTHCRAVDKAENNARYDKGYSDGYDKGYADGKTVMPIRYVDRNNNDNYYDDGYSDGKTEGYDKGYKEGYEAGKWDGYQEGEEMGYYDGYKEGKKDGYNEGYEDGEYEGELQVMQTYDNIGKYW